jgi:hypothetical protein
MKSVKKEPASFAPKSGMWRNFLEKHLPDLLPFPDVPAVQ